MFFLRCLIWWLDFSFRLIIVQYDENDLDMADFMREWRDSLITGHTGILHSLMVTSTKVRLALKPLV